MNERGIAFSGEKIRLMQAMFARGVTEVQTRRVWKTQPLGQVTSVEQWVDRLWRIEHEQVGNHVGLRIKCPYQVGQILYAREGYQVFHVSGINTILMTGRYLADGVEFCVEITPEESRLWHKRKYPYVASPGRFMYKSLTRYRFEVTEIRAQQIQDIVLGDVATEGWPYAPTEKALWLPEVFEAHESGFYWFIDLWDSLNAVRGYSWESNCWCFAYTLRLRDE